MSPWHSSVASRHETWVGAKIWNIACPCKHNLSVYPFPSAIVYPRLWPCMLGDRGSPHKQKVKARAIELELLHLPREVSLLFMRQLKFSAHAIHCVYDKRSQDNLATPNTNNTAMVRDRSSRTLIVGVGLWPP